MLKSEELTRLDQIIAQHNRFIITTHVNPDGDGLGSEIALAHYLRQRKKAARILNSSQAPENCQFLNKHHELELYSEAEHVEYVTSADVVFILDISDWDRLRDLGKLIKKMPMLTVCIDHHLVHDRFADVDIIYPAASSTGELIFELLIGLGAKMSQAICEAIYTAILTDTGSFRYSNTTPRTHHIVAQLLELGVNFQEIYRNIYENQSLPRVQLMGRVLANMQMAFDNRLAWMVITQDMLRETGTTLRDTEGLADYPRTIAGIEIALLFMELDDGRVKISFRSKGRIEINGLAKIFSGGGHAFASGASTAGPLQKVIEKTLAHAAKLFETFSE